MGTTDAVCKKRWKNIKDSYVRRLRKIKNAELPKSLHSYKHNLPFLRITPQEFLDTPDIKIQSVASSVDTNDAICIEESMDSDAEYITPHLLQFNTVDNSEVCRPSASSKTDSTPFSKFPKEPSPFDTNAGQRCSSSSTWREIKTEEEHFDERVKAIVEKRNGKIEELLTKIVLQGQEDSLDLFFRSIAMSVRKLQPNLIQEAKIRVLQLLKELEDKQSESADK